MTNEIQEIVEVLRRASDQYYNDGQSELTDQEYDVLEQQLRELDPTNPFLLGVGSLVRGDKVRLPFPMPSLDQVYNGDLARWIRDNELGLENLVVSDKLDGTSILLVYGENGILQNAYSRGNGVEGQDVTRHVKAMKKAPQQARQKMVVRAEVILEEETFKKYKSQIEAEGNREFKNSRNFCAGQMNSSEALKLFYEHADVVAYEIVWPELSKAAQFIALLTSEFITAGHRRFKGSNLTTETITHYLEERIRESSYTLDGLVIDVDDVNIRRRLTAAKRKSGLNPAYAKKFKVAGSDNLAITTVTSVEWNTSKDRYLKPTVHLKSTELVGVTIRKATGFNAKFIQENQVGPGATVEITRSGDVIPYIRKVLTPAPTGASMPDAFTKGLAKWNASNVDLCLDADDDDSLFQRLILGVKTIGAEFLAEKSLEKLFGVGYTTLTDIIQLAYNDEVDAVAAVIGSEVMARKGLASMRAKLNPVPIEVLGDASGCFGRGIGTRKLRKIYQAYGKITGLTFSEVLEVEGFSEITAKQFADNQAKFEAFLNSIKSCYSIQQPISKPKSTGNFTNLTFVFTGFRDTELEAKIQSKGGEIASAVNAKTTHLVAKDLSKQSSKMKKAAEKGIQVISRVQLEDMLL